jgi:hypothetical protein
MLCALTTLYYATEGANWQTQTGCSKFANHAAFNCLCLSTANNKLIGSMPDEVSARFALKRFDVFAHAMFGTIPQGISNLVQLVLLDLEEKLLTGPAAPTSLFDLSALLACRASDNSLTGLISTRIGTLLSSPQKHHFRIIFAHRRLRPFSPRSSSSPCPPLETSVAAVRKVKQDF